MLLSEMTFRDFVNFVYYSIAKGEIGLPEGVTLNELDLAIQYATGREQEAKGTTEITLTIKDIWDCIGKYCGEDVQKRLEAHDY